MIHVKIRSILTFKKILGTGDLDLSIPEDTSLTGVLKLLVERYGPPLATELYDADGALFQHVRLMVNGRDYAFLENRMATSIREGDEILILPPVAGG